MLVLILIDLPPAPSSGSDSETYPGESAVGEAAAAGSGCSSPEYLIPCGMYSGTSAQGIKSWGRRWWNHHKAAIIKHMVLWHNAGPSIPGEPMSKSSSTGKGTDVYVTVESSESDMIIYEIKI
ncbi:hypothetical protein Tco_0149940 [Tanacetum coccineum]